MTSTNWRQSVEWTVHEFAERAGVSGRTLRHYHQIRLLEPDRVGSNGYRYYGLDAVSRLQRILLLRETGMPLADIAAVLDASVTPEVEIEALAGHLEHLTKERSALDRRINAVEHTLSMRRQGHIFVVETSQIFGYCFRRFPRMNVNGKSRLTVAPVAFNVTTVGLHVSITIRHGRRMLELAFSLADQAKM